MKTSILYSLLIILSTSFAQAQLSAQEQAQIDSIFTDWNNPNAPGGAVGVVKKGKLIFSKGYGAANLDYNIPNTTQSVFRIASTSKQFTAACIILLMQQGKLSLEDKLIKFFPDFPPYAEEVTIQHLLNHTSGISDYLGIMRLAGLSRESHFTDETIRRWLTNIKELNFKPGEKLSYSNSGYWLLGQIVKNVSGETLAEFAMQNIFIPLDMNNTHYHNNHKQVVKNRAYGYAPNERNGFDISMTTLDMIGSGGVFTTVEDLKKWDDAFYKSNVLNRDFWYRMTSVGMLNDGTKLNYASGLGIENYKGNEVIRHGGGFFGFRAELIRFPASQLSVIFLANRADVDPSGKAFQIADIFLQDKHNTDEQSTSSNLTSTSSKPENTVALSQTQLQTFSGAYWCAQDKTSRVLEVRNDTLCYVRTNGRVTKMIPIAENKFLWEGYNASIVVKFDNKGDKFTLESDFPGWQPYEYIAYTPISSLSQFQLEQYSGDYYSEELAIFYSLRIEDNNLTLFINGNKIAPLNPVMKNVLTTTERLNKTLEFDPNLNEFKLSIDRIYNLKFSKR